MTDLDLLVYEQKQDFDKIPYVDFLEHLSERPNWKKHIENLDSPFLKLMQLENLFFFKTMGEMIEKT